MSADFSIRPVATPAPTQFVPNAVRDAVKTELPVQQTVTPSVVVQQARNDVAALAAVPDQISRQITFDRDSAMVVYQSVDQRTSEVVRQYPEDAMLRRRAYFRSLDMMSAEKALTPNPVEKKA